MKAVLQSLEALPIDRASRHPDVLLAGLVAAIVGMMIIPVPAAVLDVLLALNLALSAIILVSALLSDRALSLSTFPSLLLLTTLFRLALNVSTARLVLSKGDAGHVVQAFGHLVLSGDILVGGTIFLIITLVQFLVIAKGAERVAEVGARFTLDAMPGKQMAIDAAVRQGALLEEGARKERDELSRESQFYGAMDGAMKFIRGDAIAGLVITAINGVGGLIVGVLRFHMSASESIDRFSVLSVGDGLVSQIPALLITLSAGILTTRVSSQKSGDDLGTRIKLELFQSAKVLAIAGALALVLAVIPGLPCAPFALIATALLLGAMVHEARGRRRRAEAARGTQSKREAMRKAFDEKAKEAKAQRTIADQMAPAVIPIGVDLDRELSSALGFGEADDPELIATLVPQLRDALYLETGVRFPGVRFRARAPAMNVSTFIIRIKDVPVLRERLSTQHALAIESPDRLRRLGVPVQSTRHPVLDREVSLIPLESMKLVEATGVQVWDPAGVLALHIARALRRHAKDFVGLQETGELIERLEKAYPTLVKEVVPKIVTLAQLSDVLKRLVDEGVSIRDLKSILEALAHFGPYQNDNVALTEHVRAALSLQISHSVTGFESRMSAVLLDGVIEDAIRSGISQTVGGSYLALEPEIRRSILGAVARALGPAISQGIRPVILTTVEIRRYVRKLVEEDFPDVTVLSFQELPAALTIQPLGRALLADDLRHAA
jgi:type III secretion protein V